MTKHCQKLTQRIEPIDIVSVIVLFVIVTVLAVLIYFCFHPITQNVFDQLYYEVRAVKYGRDSVLVSGTESAYARYEFGEVESIQIPELDMDICIRGDTLYILFFHTVPNGEWDTSYWTHYKYHLKEKRLYGERPLDDLTDAFLTDYFAWYSNAGKSNPYSAEDLGEYEFEFQETVYYD